MRITPAEILAQRLADADRRLIILRQATRDMQSVRAYLLEERRREPERSRRDSPPRR